MAYSSCAVRALLAAAAVTAGLLPAASPNAATFVVNSVSDVAAGDNNPGDGICEDIRSGTRCTLRAAIEEANATPIFDMIHFNVGSYFVINLESPLPTITALLDIDGRTEVGYNSAATDLSQAPPRVYLNGSGLGATPSADGLRFFNTSGWVNAIGLINFPDNGIEVVNGGTGVLTIDGCWIGLAANGALAGNGRGIYLNNVDNVRIGKSFSGTTLVGLGNVISANAGAGIRILLGEDNVIAGNRIGTSPGGTSPRGNGGNGIELLGPYTQVGDGRGLGDGSFINNGNLIAHNGGNGIDALAGGQMIVSNTIRSNEGAGVQLAAASSRLGFTSAGQRNLIHLNEGAGVLVAGSDHLIRNNAIFENEGRGLHATGSAHEIHDNDIYYNGDEGVRIDAAGVLLHSNRIGVLAGTIASNLGKAVVIAGHDNEVHINSIGGGLGPQGDGVDVASGAGNRILDNAIGLGPNANLGHEGVGVRVRAAATGTRIDRNRIGYSLHGIALEGSTTLVCDNWIGMDSGGEPRPNRSEGIFISGDGNLIGDDGLFPCAAGNRIGYNVSDGIEVSGSANVIRRNSIGVVDMTSAGNGNGGILIGAGAADNLVADNALKHNGNDGIRVGATAGERNEFSNNQFEFNGDLGIDLGDDGPDVNDGADADEGPNRRQNHPIWVGTGSSPAPGQYSVQYWVNSVAPNSAYPITVEFYRAGSGNRQGSERLLSTSYTVAGVTQSATITLPAGVTSGSLLALAIDAEGNTSEFGPPLSFSSVVLGPQIFRNGFEQP